MILLNSQIQPPVLRHKIYRSNLPLMRMMLKLPFPLPEHNLTRMLAPNKPQTVINISLLTPCIVLNFPRQIVQLRNNLSVFMIRVGVPLLNVEEF